MRRPRTHGGRGGLERNVPSGAPGRGGRGGAAGGAQLSRAKPFARVVGGVPDERPARRAGVAVGGRGGGPAGGRLPAAVAAPVDRRRVHAGDGAGRRGHFAHAPAARAGGAHAHRRLRARPRARRRGQRPLPLPRVVLRGAGLRAGGRGAPVPGASRAPPRRQGRAPPRAAGGRPEDEAAMWEVYATAARTLQTGQLHRTGRNWRNSWGARRPGRRGLLRRGRRPRGVLHRPLPRRHARQHALPGGGGARLAHHSRAARHLRLAFHAGRPVARDRVPRAPRGGLRRPHQRAAAPAPLRAVAGGSGSPRPRCCAGPCSACWRCARRCGCAPPP
jgi:hypothetical protein